MKIRPTLLHMLLRGTLFGAIFSGIAMALAVLLPRDPLTSREPLPLFFLIVLAIACAGLVIGCAHRYTMTRGFSSDCVWAHVILAGLIALVVSLLPPALVLWTGFRSFYQEHVRQNPLYPLMAPTEMMLPLVWLVAGVFLLTTALFAAIRVAQPTRSRGAAPLFFVAIAMALLTVAELFAFADGWQLWLILAATAVVTLSLLLSSRHLHRSLEVPS